MNRFISILFPFGIIVYFLLFTSSCKKEKSIFAVADFTYSGRTDTVPTTIQFINNSFGLSYIWDFGDGSGSTEKNPYHIYNQVGTYRVNLIARGSNNDDTMKVVIEVGDYIPRNGLVGWWPFNGNADDESGKGNHGSIVNANLTTDRFLNDQAAINQQDDGSFVRTQNIILNVENTFSISLWANPLNDDIVKIQGVTGNEGPGKMSVIHPPHGSNWGSSMNNAGVGINVGRNQVQVVEHSHLYIASPLVYSGQIFGWSHIVLLYENRIPKLFVNGEFKATGLMSPKQSVRPGGGYCNVYNLSGFGTSFSPNGNPVGNFKGSYDDIGIWNRALTQQEITNLYNGGR